MMLLVYQSGSVLIPYRFEGVFAIIYEVRNTLYITLDSAHLRYSNGNVVIEHEESPLRQVPLHHLGALMLFGNITATAPLIEACAHEGRAIVWFDTYGQFRARLYGPTTGNVLLRCAQHDAQRCPKTACRLAKGFRVSTTASPKGECLR